MKDVQPKPSDQSAAKLGAADKPANSDPTRLLSAEAFVTRLAEDLRTKGDPDLPLTFYIEQARQLLLTGNDQHGASDSPHVKRAVGDQLYQSWALGKG